MSQSMLIISSAAFGLGFLTGLVFAALVLIVVRVCDKVAELIGH